MDSYFKSSFVDLNFVASVSSAKYTMKQKNGALRCEYLELLVRVSQYKFLRTGQCQNTI